MSKVVFGCICSECIRKRKLGPWKRYSNGILVWDGAWNFDEPFRDFEDSGVELKGPTQENVDKYNAGRIKANPITNEIWEINLRDINDR